jgi:hypothetical protein
MQPRRAGNAARMGRENPVETALHLLTPKPVWSLDRPRSVWPIPPRIARDSVGRWIHNQSEYRPFATCSARRVSPFGCVWRGGLP